MSIMAAPGSRERGEAAHALAESRAGQDGFRARLAASLGGPEREVSEEKSELDPSAEAGGDGRAREAATESEDEQPVEQHVGAVGDEGDVHGRGEDVLGLQILGEHLKPVVGEAPHQLLAESVREAREVGRLADTAEDRTDEHQVAPTGTHSAVTATMPVWVQSPYARGCFAPCAVARRVSTAVITPSMG